MKPVNPVLLADESIAVSFNDHQLGVVSEEVATVQGDSAGGYKVTIHTDKVEKLSREIDISANKLTLGLLYHEVAHIRYGSFENVGYSNDLERWVDNLVEDTRIEYHMSFEYPYVAKYIAMVLAASKNTIMAQRTIDPAVNPDAPADDDDIIAEATATLLQMVKYNYIPDDCDPEFVDFMFPRILLARRSGRPKAVKIVKEICAYLKLMCQESGKQPGNLVLKKWNPCSDTEEANVNKLQSSDKDAKNLKGKVQKDALSKAKEIDKQIEDMAGGMTGGKGADEVIDDLVGSNDYIRRVIARESDVIKKVHKAFSEIFTKNIDVPVKDGDINIKRIQEAYMNNLTAEEDYDYHIWNKAHARYDCVILRDVSSSIGSASSTYAESAVIVTKALEELKNVNVAVIDFDCGARITKRMEQPLIKSDIKPRAMGGTNLKDALRILKHEVPFKNKTRLVVLITDGYPHEEEECKNLIQSEEYSEFTWLPIYFGSDWGYGYGVNFLKETFGYYEQFTDVKDLHKAVYKLLKKRVMI